MHTVRALSISFASALVALVVTVLLHSFIPEVLSFGVSNPPVPGTVYTAEELQQKEALARQQLQQAMAASPQLTAHGLVQNAFVRFAWVAAAVHLVVALRLRKAGLAQQGLAAMPFVGLATLTGAYWLVLVFIVVAIGVGFLPGSKNVAAGT